MGGPRSKKYYVNQYGETEGTVRYNKVLENREKKEKRKNSQKATSPNLSDLTQAHVDNGDAIQCMGCNVFLTRLQWTHFKNKCKIKTLAEYKNLFPNEPLISPNLVNRTKQTEDNMILLYGEVEGKEKWNTYKEKQAKSNSFEYKSEKHGWTKEQYDDFNKSRAVTVDNLAAKHGEIVGNRIWESYIEKQRYTNTLEYYIEKHGDVDTGNREWLKYNEEKGNFSDPERVAERYGITLAEAIDKISKKYHLTGVYVSNIEKQFISELEAYIGEDLKYTYKTKQYSLYSKNTSELYFYDACCTQRNKIIEFNGDFWHANPLLYEQGFINPITKKSTTEIWNRDAIKIKTAKDRGFDVLVVWEKDYVTDTVECIKGVVEWLEN